MKINVLSPNIYNKISAGEVVERPASIVKELIENSIDAGAKKIRIEVEEGGIKNITISDDGCGIEKDDLVTAFLPHATSKIKSEEDLDIITSLGFRGEALASIAAISQVRLSSKTQESSVGYSLKVDGGNFGQVVEIARSVGTTISCSNIFFNTPVRAKFLKKPKTEEAEITHLVEKFMLSHSDISFQYYADGKQVYNTTSCSMQDIIYTIYGNDVYKNLVEVNYKENGYSVYGYITKPQFSKSNRTQQTLFVNGRFVENSMISTCIQNIYSSFLMKGRFPVYVLSLNLPPDCVDVNVHPSKREVRFENQSKIYGLFMRAVEKALYAVDEIQSFIHFDETKQEVESDDRGDALERLVKNTIENFDNPLPLKKMSESEGKSFSVDLYENDDPKEFNINIPEYEKGENEVNKDEQPNAEPSETSSKKKDLKTFYFDTENVKNSRDIQDTTSFLQADVKEEMKILGTVFNTYILVEYDDSLYFIDQHAGHERILYDKLVKKIDEGTNVQQNLLVPYTFTLSPKESQNVELLLGNLSKIGFDIDKRGYNYSINAIPLLLSYIDLEKFVDEIVSESIGLENKASDFIHSKLCQSACKHAIKGGDAITKDECAYLIEEVRKGVMLCPHGRPITLIITKHEFEKMFKRIV